MPARQLAAALVLAVLAPSVFAAGAPLHEGREPLALPLVPSAVFPAADPFDYSDVVLLGNNNSATSRNLTAHFALVRGVAADHIFLADLPDVETINDTQWATFAAWFTGEMGNRSLGPLIDYIVTFKGVPIRVWWPNANGPTSFQDELMLLGGTYSARIGNAGLNGYANPYFNRTERFSFSQFGIRLVTGIYAYNESTAMALIDRSANSLGSRGEFVLDTDASKGYSGGWGGYAYANEALVWANATLAALGEATYLDLNNTYVTGRTNVMGYSSWGSNDCCWGSATQLALPHNTWVNGSIGETFVSTGGRSFTWPPSYGQSMIADWIDEGATGMKGYTDEPYIAAIADGHILYGRYARGYNLAESYWAASHLMGWRQIVIGDPKMAPYADVPDLAVNATLSSVPPAAVQFGNLSFTLGVANSGAVNETVGVAFDLSGTPVANLTLAARGHASSRFDITLDLSALDPGVWGALNLTATLDPGGLVREWNEANNAASFPTEVRRTPVANATLERTRVLTFEPVNLTLAAPRADRPIDHFELALDGGAPFNVSAVADAASYSTSFPKSGAHGFSAVAVDSAGLRSAPLGPLVVVVDNRAPSARIAVNASAPATLVAVAFNGSGSSDPDGRIAYYTWDAGPLGLGGGPEFVLTFSRPGPYLVVLTVTDDEGATAMASLTVNASNRAPVAAVSANVSGADTLVPIAVSAAGSVDLDGSIVSFDFLFDDGAHYTQATPEVVHAFATPGTRGVWLEVTDDAGAKSRAHLSLEVADRPPTASWAPGANFTVPEGVDSTFAAGLRDLDSNLSSYTLDFGDGTRVTGALTGPQASVQATHTYSAEGSFPLTLTVLDEWGAATALEAQAESAHPQPVVASEKMVVEAGNLSLTFEIVSPYGSLELVVELDGAPWKQEAVEANGTLSARLPDLAPGNHTVRASVTDGVKTTLVASQAFAVEAPPAAPEPPVRPAPPEQGPPLLGALLALGAGLGVVVLLNWRRKRPRAPAAGPAPPRQRDGTRIHEAEAPRRGPPRP